MSRPAPLLLAITLALRAVAAEASTILTFDEFPHATALSTEFASAGVILGSTAPIGPTASSDPADSLQPGEAVAPFVFAVVAVPSSSTPSLPNKVIGSKFDTGGGLIQCERCGIRITFLDPIPRDVSLWITDPDAGQTVEFFGPSGILDTTILAPASSAFPELVAFSDAGGIDEIVLISAPSVGIGFDSLQFSDPVPEPGTAHLLLLGVIVLGISRRAHRASP